MSWRAHPHVRTGDELSVGERWADKVRNGMGSWRFIWIQTAIVGLWIVGNVVTVPGIGTPQWDPYPFILLNLAFSTQAAYASPIILLAQKRGDQRAAEVALGDYQTDQATLGEVTGLRSEVAELRQELADFRTAMSQERA